MKKMCLLFLCLLISIIPVSALSYEREPSIEVLSISYLDPQKGITTPISSNYISKGEKILVITIYNSAVREKVEYSNLQESLFFNSREDMLFTAYNVELELEGNEAVKVKAGKVKLPAIPALHTVSLQFPIEVISGEEVTITLKVQYEVIDRLETLETFTQFQRPTEFTTTITNSSSGISISNTTRYHIEIPTKEYSLRYSKKETEIPIRLIVEERVLISVEDVKTGKLIAGGKGDIKVVLKNVGKKVARNAYAILELPKAQTQTTATVPSALPMSLLMLQQQQIPSGVSQPFPQPSYFIGDLKPGDFAIAEFRVPIEVTSGGIYPVKIKLVYTDDFGNLKETDPVTFGIEVLSKPKIDVKDVKSDVFVNSKGDVIVKMISDVELVQASARIVVSPPLSALSSECYIGDIKAGEEFTAIFRLKASSEAKATKYPAEIYLKFKAGDDFSESDAIRIGVEVQPEVDFEVIGIPEMYAGEEKIVVFGIKNTGNLEVRDATARLIIVSPFSSTDDTAFFGNLKPGEVANVSFKISVDRDATPKLYALNLEVKYRTENGEWVISKPEKAIISVKAPPLNYLLYLILIVAAIAAIAYYVKRKLK
ncbi:MAG: S-layer protein [Archaeoglobaceae archaeon]